MPTKCYVIGVAGASCSGKTTVSQEIHKKVQLISNDSSICILSQDNYYFGGTSEDNYDVPEALDFKLMITHLQKLIAGESVDIPLYDHSIFTRKTETQKIGPAKIIIIEGILIFTQEELRNLCDLKVFVEAEPALCCIRRMNRDQLERGRTLEEIQTRYIDHVIPSFNNYINPSKYNADISLINNKSGQFIGLEILLNHIEKKLAEL